MKTTLQYARTSTMTSSMDSTTMRTNSPFKLGRKPVQAAIFMLMTAGISSVSTIVWAQASSAAAAPPSISSEVAASCNSGVAFKSGQDGSYIDAINNGNSGLPVSAELGLWQQSKGLPLGSKVLLSVSDVKAPADGRSTLKLSFKAYDEQGKVITTPIKFLVETSLGRLSVGGYSQQIVSMEVATQSGEACVNLVAPAIPGESLLRVSSGAVKVEGKIDFLPDLRPMLVVGVVEGSLSLTKFKKDALTPNIATTDFEEELRNFGKTTESDDGNTRKTAAGRVALFIKGTVKGEYLLTAAYDSDKIVQQKLFRDIDPNTYYPIYGDASIKNFDAQSKSRLYVRIDKDKSYMLYGDYNTAATDDANKLGSYSRSLTGAKGHYENDTVKVNLWAAKDTLRAFVDEQAGQGISGPYAVGQPNAVANSEKVELLVRDRNQPSIILKREELTRFVDYDFEPFTGKILFRKAIPSVDEVGNPVFIRTTYEVDEGGEKFWVGGVDAKLKVGPVTVGASHIEDKNTISPHKLSSFNAQLKLGEQTFIVAEVAKSQGTQFYNQSIETITQQTTGYNTALGGVVPAKITQSGQAARIEARHNGDDLQARAYISKTDAGFQNSNAGVTPGREEAGFSASLKLSKELTVKSDVTITKDTITASQRDLASLSVNYKLDDKLMLDVGLNHVNETGVGGGLSLNNSQNGFSSVQGLGWGSNTGYGFNGSNPLGSPTNTLGQGTAGGIIDSKYTSAKVRLTGKVTEDLSLYGEYEADVNDTQKHRSAVGGEYRINEKSRIYARHEFENTLSGNVNGITLDGSNTQSSIVGIDTSYMKDGQLFSEYRLTGAQNGFDVAAAVGIRNQWQVSEGLTLNTSAERQALRPYEGAKGDAVAMSIGALYSTNPIYKAAGKLEYRTSRTTDQYNVIAAYDRKLSDNWSAIARELLLYSHDRWNTGAGDQTQNRFQLGLAYRDTLTNQFHGLARFEHRIDNSTAIADTKDNSTAIFSLHGNYRPIRSTTITGQVAFKSVNETFGDVRSKWNGSLISGRYTYDINDRFDASVFASRMWGSGGTVAGAGVELGARIIDNLWIGASYNKGKFVDTELFSSNASWTGWYMRARYKIDY